MTQYTLPRSLNDYASLIKKAESSALIGNIKIGEKTLDRNHVVMSLAKSIADRTALCECEGNYSAEDLEYIQLALDKLHLVSVSLGWDGE